MMLAPDPMGRWLPVPATPGKVTEAGLIVYRFGADLFYANQNRFTDEVRALVKQAPPPVRWFIVDAGAITDIDYRAAQSIRDLLEELARRKVCMIFGRVSPYLRADMDRHGITAAWVGSAYIPTLHEAVASGGTPLPAGRSSRLLMSRSSSWPAAAPGPRCPAASHFVEHRRRQVDGSTGLLRKSFMPQRWLRARSSGKAFAVMATIGTSWSNTARGRIANEPRRLEAVHLGHLAVHQHELVAGLAEPVRAPRARNGDVDLDIRASPACRARPAG